MSDRGFLSRWSRRKQRARRQSAAAEPAPPSASAGMPENLPEAELSAEELARLPRLDELTADTDLAPFLRKGVPKGLRNAALRRLWALDPKIRDHVGDALDYAYDWNIPGGVPGSGPLAAQHIDGLLRRVIGDSEPATAPASPDAALVQFDTKDAGPAKDAIEAPVHSDADPPYPGAIEQPTEPEDEPVPISRRHGGAMPV